MLRGRQEILRSAHEFHHILMIGPPHIRFMWAGQVLSERIDGICALP